MSRLMSESGIKRSRFPYECRIEIHFGKNLNPIIEMSTLGPLYLTVLVDPPHTVRPDLQEM